jgi:hypothetical protein
MKPTHEQHPEPIAAELEKDITQGTKGNWKAC